MNEINHDEVETFIELRGVYDGWSIAKMKDGSYINRWHPADARYQPTNDFIWMLENEE